MYCMPQNFSSISDHSGRDTSMSFVSHTHDLTNILRKRLFLQQSVERDRICQWVDVIHLLIIEQRCSSCFPTLAGLKSRIEGAPPPFQDLERIHHRTGGKSQVWSDCLPTSSNCSPSEYEHWKQRAMFFDASCFFICARASQSKLL